ncbi:MAG: L-2-amino-thiazoline-4-carboxylic acid hydrolase [Lachnospiraceae bacterium]|nr:L-2-amino-thiazoline-4-carboxylic acid hydrolase [Lachnospiraceae bacterium]
MKNTFKVRFLSAYFHNIMKPEYRNKSISRKRIKDIAKEHKKITIRAGEMSDDKLISSYIMAIYFIAMNRKSGLGAEENYEILKHAISSSKLLRSTMGNSDSYLDEKKLPGRFQWAKESKKRAKKNNWVVDVLPGCDEYDLGYDYYECGVCKICRDEGCLELAKYMCRLDFVIADIMGMKLVRTKTLAEGAELCDFRYSRR